MESIGGEIPFYISSYNPSQEVYIFSEIERLKNRLKINGISYYDRATIISVIFSSS